MLRPRLFGIAYRVLGSAADADDVVQDTWLRWHGADRREVRDPTAFLTTVARRLAINVASSARVRRETGSSLSEPTGNAVDPMRAAQRGEALRDAIRLLAEQLTPIERAAYVLREAFDYPYRQIAEITSLSEANARQVVRRARARLSSRRRRTGSAHAVQRLLDAFVLAEHTGDLGPLERMFADDIAAGAAVGAPIPIRATRTWARSAGLSRPEAEAA